MAVWPAPQGRVHSMTNRPAVSATYFTTASPRRRFGITAFDIGADNAETVIGVVAGQMEFDHRSLLDDDFGRRKGETLRGHANHLHRIL